MSILQHILFYFMFLLAFFIFDKENFFFVQSLSNDKNKYVNILNANNIENIFNDNFSFIDSLINSISKILKKVPLGVLKKKIIAELGKVAKDLKLPNPDEEICDINYSELCPEGWVNFGDGKNCLSPSNYVGPCKKKVSFKNKTAINKYEFSVKCNVSWPCIGKCVEDFTKNCPENWILKKKNICYAPKSYKDICVKEKNFTNFSKSEKKIWGDICNVNWPCYQKNYNILCPLGWKKSPDNKSCIGPESYTGPCKNILYLNNLNKNEKILLKNICNIEWPIYQDNEQNFDSFLCPTGWNLSQINNSICIAPKNYIGPCAKQISLSTFSKEDKSNFSKNCLVHWPFIQNTKNKNSNQNFNFPCPDNWELINQKKEKNICIAPKNYIGPCNNIVSFKNYTNEMKEAWAYACKVNFPYDNLKHTNNKKVENEQNEKNLKIYGIRNSNNTMINIPSINNGPFGSSGSIYEGLVLDADKGIEYGQNRNKSKNKSKIVIQDFENIDSENFIITDDKIKDLILLKESTENEKMKQTIDETIKQLRTKYTFGKFDYSFIQA
ncbi:upregulated in late gametocytes ULG8 [Plasmodium yoelii yoelii]|uniref:Upregulated in late gametocytes ULG8 n=3 Tax=Plasmodium yoelii TaxID=5861 RepID=A0AAE9WVF4_PLAYO|nr:upregulated in late gametocytes ULG8 [Plasmodium yoelii yoelii]